MILRCLLAGCLVLTARPLVSQVLPQPKIRSIRIVGNVRIPEATIRHYISSVENGDYDPARIQADLRNLHDLGAFASLTIESSELGDGRVDLTYRVLEHPLISELAITGIGEGQQDQMRKLLEEQKISLRPGTLFHPEDGVRAANAIRNHFRAHKYPLAEVRLRSRVDNKNNLSLSFDVETGPRIDIGEVNFSGNQSIPAGRLRAQLQQSRPTLIWAPWTATGAYMPASLLADLDALRRYYQSRGFASVQISAPQIAVREFPRRWWLPFPGLGGPKQKLSIMIPVTEGPVFQLVSVDREGDARFAAAAIDAILASVKTPAPYDVERLEAVRAQMTAALGHDGYAMAQVQLEQDIRESDRTVRAHYRILAGDPVAIGRIRFAGNVRLRDRFLRRELVVREGEMFDAARLDKSLKRLNRSGIILPCQRSDVAMELDQATGMLDITFHVKEKPRQGIYATGGTGGIGGGYLGVLYTAFDLLGLGESLTMELDGGASQSNFLLNILGTRFLGFPFTLGLSVFHRVTNINVASIVPDTGDLISLLRHRSTGMGLTGSYEVASQVHAGVGAQFEGRSVSAGPASDGASVQTGAQRRMDLTPFFLFDATRGEGPGMRGSRLAASTSWSGSILLRSVDATAQSFRFSTYVDDPLTRGKNSLAFHFQGAFTRPRNGVPLTLDRRFYPGDELVRGFRRGGLSPWAEPVGGSSVAGPAGADTVLGLSAEYRIPIRGALSAAAFADFGWSRLSPRTARLDGGTRLIAATDGLLRASVGGELRLELPVLHQPGRLIFAWNPLRLNTLIQGISSPFRLADPRGSIRFALGDR